MPFGRECAFDTMEKPDKSARTLVSGRKSRSNRSVDGHKAIVVSSAAT